MSGGIVTANSSPVAPAEPQENSKSYAGRSILSVAPDLVRSFSRALRKRKEDVAEILEKTLPLSKRNPCLNCIHSRADLLMLAGGFPVRVTDRVCYYSLRSSECQPIDREPPEAEDVVSAVREVASGVILSYANLLKKQRAPFKMKYLVRAIILVAGLKKNPCLNCIHSRALSPKVILRLREAGRIDIFARACRHGLTQEICGSERVPFIDPSAAKLVVLRRKIFASLP